MRDTEFGTDIAAALTECEIITVRSDGQAEDSPRNLVVPTAFVTFLNADAEFEVDDIQVDPQGWELVELTGDGTYGDGVTGPLSTIQTVHPDMVAAIDNAPGVYALVAVEGVYPEHLSLYSDFQLGTALARYVGDQR